jgi:hypothetical protein
MSQTALRLRHKTSAWASWLPHWLAHLHVQNLARRFDGFDSTTVSFMALPG